MLGCTAGFRQKPLSLLELTAAAEPADGGDKMIKSWSHTPGGTGVTWENWTEEFPALCHQLCIQRLNSFNHKLKELAEEEGQARLSPAKR